MRLKKHEVKAEDRYVLVTDKKYRMNTLLKRQLDIFINFVEYDSDMVILIDGEIEGVGKSTLAQQIGYYFAHKTGTGFNVDNIVFTPSQFEDAIKTAPRFSSIVWDEAYKGANKFRMMSEEYQTISNLVQQIRQRNLFIVIVMPSFFDMSKYFAVRRSWALIHCYLKAQIDQDEIESGAELDFDKPVLQKGYFRFYTRATKKRLYNRGKKDEDYDVARARFVGMFSPAYAVAEQEYKDKKAHLEEQPKFSEREFIEECLQRDMPIPVFKDYVSYAREYIYDIKRKISRVRSKENT